MTRSELLDQQELAGSELVAFDAHLCASESPTRGGWLHRSPTP